jgi:hypothetical protein
VTSQEARNNNSRTSSAETVVIAQLYRNKLYHLPIIMVDKLALQVAPGAALYDIAISIT